MRRASHRPAGFALLDLLLLVVLLVLLAGAALPAAVSRRRENDNRMRCANNLRQVGQAIQMYMNENKGKYPRTRYDPARADKPTAYTRPGAKDPFAADGPEANDVTAGLFLLLRTQELPSDAMVCPAARGRKWSGEVQEASNFLNRRQLSYSYANPYPSDAASGAGYKLTFALTSDFAIAADMNPGDEALLKINSATARPQILKGNSLNHDQEGQNVLYADGHVEFQNVPFCGELSVKGDIASRDNIYTYGPSGKDRGGAGVVGSPTGPKDSVLLPTANEGAPPPEPPRPPAPKPARPELAWTLEEADQRLKLSPDDPYLQYVVLQLARREDKQDAHADEIEARAFGGPNSGRRDVDLLGLFTGADAVHESLQLDTMRGDAADARLRQNRRRMMASTQPADPQAQAPKGPVGLSSLKGPTVKSHPWEQMLAAQARAGKKPQVSPLSQCVPEDFYLAEFRSVGKLLEAADTTDLWGSHLFVQASQQARDERFAERLKAQLAIKTEKLLRPFYDQVVESVAATGSDPFWREGSDVTFLFRLKAPDVFRARMDGLLEEAQKSATDAKREEGTAGGVPFVHLSTPDRRVSVFSAYPSPGLHVRGNSRAAFDRVLAAIKGGEANSAVNRLGDSDEFQYVRTLLPPGADQEDGLVYLSDPFIRRLVGPRVKLTERRRLVCANHLRMIGHAALLYRTEHGKAPASLKELADAQCAPGVFGEQDLACPDGGKYGLSADGTTGTCSVHGSAHFLTPCIELPLETVSGEEAEDYTVFLDLYSRYWRRYFDPIALRLQLTPKRCRVETLVLPLIDNSIYTALAHALGGPPEALDALPVPGRNIFSVAVKLNKEKLLEKVSKDKSWLGDDWLGVREQTGVDLNVKELVSRGLGNQVGFHVYDEHQLFDLNLPQLFGMAAASGRGWGEDDSIMDNELVMFLPIIASINSPIYLSFPVQDVKVVDQFLGDLDKALSALAARRDVDTGFIGGLGSDFYRLPPTGDGPDAAAQAIRCGAIRFGPITWRFFWARIGNGLYVASKQFVIDDLVKAQQAHAGAGARSKDDASAGGPATASAMARVRARNWERVLSDFRLAWAENNRRACLDNLAPLVGVRRAYAESTGVPPDAAKAGAEVQDRSGQLYGVHFFCPEGGHYVVAPDGKEVTCDVHGSPAGPRQPAAPATNTDDGKLLDQFAGMTATLTFLEDGLHAVVTIERK